MLVSFTCLFLPCCDVCVCVCVSRSVVSNPLGPHGLQPARLLCPWDSPGKNTGVGCHALFQEIFPTQGSNLHLLHCRQILYHWATRKAPCCDVRLKKSNVPSSLTGECSSADSRGLCVTWWCLWDPVTGHYYYFCVSPSTSFFKHLIIWLLHHIHIESHSFLWY